MDALLEHHQQPPLLIMSETLVHTSNISGDLMSLLRSSQSPLLLAAMMTAWPLID
jgi:hypothetical protein